MNAHAQPDEWQYWRQALAERRGVQTQPGSPRSGYFRLKDEAIAFWQEDGEVVCWRSGTFPTPTKPDAIDELFGWAAPHPISFEDYTYFTHHKRWPEQLAPVETESADDFERLNNVLTARRAEARAFIESVKTVTNQADCDKLANYADAFAKVEKAAEDARKSEKEPHLEAGRAVDAKWRPIVEDAAKCKAWAKDATVVYLKAERERIAAERQEAARKYEAELRASQKAAREAEAAGAPPPAVVEAPAPPPPAQKAKAGTSGRVVSLKSEVVYEVEDAAAFLRWLSTLNNLPADFQAVLRTLGRTMHKAGLSPPGIVTRTEERAV